MKVWFNGRLVDDAQARLSVFDHAFLYGDGLYETIRLENGRISLWPAHYARLKKAAAALRFAFPWTRTSLGRAIAAVARANKKSAATVRITVSRGTGPLGFDPALCPKPTLVIQLHPDRDLAGLRREGVTLGIVRGERQNPAFKSTSMQSTVLAKMGAKRMRVFEGILLNERGEITEGLTSNVFFIRRGVLQTPSLACGLLPGVTRAHVLRLARRANIPVREGRYRPSDLFQAQEVFITNASLALMPVRALTSGARSIFFSETRTIFSRLQKTWDRSALRHPGRP